ncbi:MAG: S1 family peptidase, partial [Lysobacter sp.]|nr:S1 family peptidase [Lysobacter sp.]
TDAASAAQARTLGVETRVVKRSLAQLDAAKSQLDRANRQRKRDAGIHAWYVDIPTNQIVIEADSKAKSAVQDLILSTGVDPTAVRFRESAGKPMTTRIVGGEGYNSAAGSCSIGFSVTRGADVGFATAGHCGPVGTATTSASNVLQGVVAGSTYPGNDSAWVRITNIGEFRPLDLVSNYAGGFVTVVGSAQAPVGAAVCRSGRTTGYRCGTISAHNVTVNYPEGATFGLTRTSACVGFGDSGGAYLTPAGQAQGVTSGGIIPAGAGDNCASASPVSFHQPIVPLLNQYGLTLFTGNGGGGSGGLPTISRFRCPDYNNSGGGTYICTIDYASATPANVVWSGGNGSAEQDAGSSTFYATCLRGQTLQVSATVRNGAGSITRTSARFACPTGPIP